MCAKEVLVSVLIPTYNRAAIIDQTLQSVIRQVHRPLEVVIINDGSKDETIDVLNEFKEKQSTAQFTVRIFSQSNRGAPTARNYAISKSRGKYLQFLDSDDALHPEKIARQVFALEESNKDIAVCDFESIYLESGVVRVKKNKGNLMLRVTFGESPNTMTPLIRADLVRNKIYWEQSMKKQQDLDFILKVFLSADGYVYTPGVWCHYLYHGADQISVAGRSKLPPFYTRTASALAFCFSVNNKNRFRPKNILYSVIAILSIQYHAIRYFASKSLQSFRAKARLR